MNAVEPSAKSNNDDVAVLASGGLDSAMLVADLVRRGRVTHPIYVRFGLAWEPAEEAHLRRFLDTLTEPAARPLVVLNSPIADVYGSHWSVSGREVPDERSADDAVYLPGRNLLLLAMPSVWCALHDVHTVALGTLKGNPFPDATPEFFDGFASLAHRGDGPCPRGRHAVRRAHQIRCPRIGPRSRAPTHVLVHRPAGRTSLWTLQQMRGTPARVLGVADRGSHGLRMMERWAARCHESRLRGANLLRSR